MRIKNVLLLLSLSLVLTACHPGTQVEVANNTGQSLTIVSMDTEMKETAYSVGSNQTVRIKVPYQLRVRRDGNVWNYDLRPTPLPQNFRKRVGGNWYREQYQIEKDGSIYVLLPDTQAPTTSLPPQPSGYPIRPR